MILHDIVVGFSSGFVAVYTAKKAVSWLPFIGGSLFFVIYGHQEGYIDHPTFDKIASAIDTFPAIFNTDETLIKNATNFINWLGHMASPFAIGIVVALLAV